MRRLLLALVLGVAACGGSKTPIYNATAVTSTAAALVDNGELVMSPNDLHKLLIIVHDACQSKQGVLAAISVLKADPYVLSMFFALAETGCPAVLDQAGVGRGQ